MVLQLVSKMTSPKWTLGAKAYALHFDGAHTVCRLGLVLLNPLVMLGPGIRLYLRFLGVASVLGFLLLPPATQICGKRVFGMM